jgi:hypothetical protein
VGTVDVAVMIGVLRFCGLLRSRVDVQRLCGCAADRVRHAVLLRCVVPAQ